ncbi:MAG: ComEA family DNA-binding protein [Aeromicrobium sp.]|uniref:ComEA family DNA-binding protein n=1 Tax=Aeromicrobium sp. TaxID=1871063 RepID=UPI0026297F03|nr:ComEA family DNA-binding protein [Aeromicrobium sp.]MDF1704010.1 ComEA family DNA-binding protein [Aeromicrobium sp.]
METEETRAEIARRRLAQLVASFEEHVPPSDADGASPSTPSVAAAREGSSPALAPAPARSHVRRRVTQLHVRVVGAVVVAVAVLLVWSVLTGRPQSTPAGVPDTSVAGLTSGPVDGSGGSSDGGGPVETGEIVVDVAGHVARPGIVTLPAGSRVHEAIEAAGGLAGAVDTTSLNLARKLVDGEQVLVGVAPVAPAAGPGSAGGLTNLNTATVDQLDELPGVGPVTAQSIVDWRSDNGPFSRVEDLLEVRGIGEATLGDLRDLVTV